MNTLRSGWISKRLYWAMSIIILCLLCICIPLIVSSSQSYLKSRQTYQQLNALQQVADLANKISRERAPANKAMSSSVQEFAQHQQELISYRQQVDRQFSQTAEVLAESGFNDLSQQLLKVKISLDHGRAQVDAYTQMPRQLRSAQELDQAILAMFAAWDSCREILRGVVIASDSSSTHLYRYISQILFLSDLRDQAGRVASSIIAHVTFATPLPTQNITRSLQTQHQVHYLWALIETIQPAEDKTDEFIRLHRRVETDFIQQGLPIVSELINDSVEKRTYHLTGTQLTEAIVDKFSTVVDLQSYLLQYSREVAIREMTTNMNHLIWTVLLSLISLLAAISTMIFARKQVFLPLIQARRILLSLSKRSGRQKIDMRLREVNHSDSLFAAIQKLQQMLQERDALEFRLKNIAHSDSLTGLANRFALEEYIRFMENQPGQLSQTCLMIIDIDHFKQVNDQYGHIIGDQVIQLVAERLKANVRATDLLVRYGGDEFLVLIENIEMDQALIVADKIRAEVVERYILTALGDQIQISVSIGVAIGAVSWMTLLSNADDALFKAKAKGRNVVAEV
ncbi:GGDEF domain-containing protein [Acinetobacter pseudolwoffii]|uniref:GGDEF domain-containing protein n=1 Tax=Acinetobacter pseudolwoffii TaxID=2053287 RepID=UPI000C247478|nr:GGDEF domain-containing protein [Acinetobacter pseudolwoffii]PJI31021.1 GGDEF domain-containing protein [Acinetobacter pseudolwoffii]